MLLLILFLIYSNLGFFIYKKKKISTGENYLKHVQEGSPMWIALNKKILYEPDFEYPIDTKK